MKKILFILSITILLCGCDHVQEIENNRIITACIVKKDEDAVTYGFYVSVPSGSEGGEDSGSKSVGRLYEFEADNFHEAVKLFENSGQHRIDISHMSLLAADINYFNEYFSYDEKYIRECISATPLIYTCILSGDQNAFVECMSTEYNSKADDFSKSILDSPGTAFKCTFPELSLAVNNKYSTVVIPSVSVETHGEISLPVLGGAAVYSRSDGARSMTDDEFAIYSNWRKKHKSKSDLFKLDVDGKSLVARLDDKNIVDVARKYALMNIDILNTKYHAKKCFLSYKAYEEFMDNYNFMSVKFLGE